MPRRKSRNKKQSAPRDPGEQRLERLAGIRDVKKRRAWLEEQGLAPDAVERELEAAHFLAKGKLKFPRAAAMRFSREGLAQASSKWVAEHRTWRMRQLLGGLESVLEVGSGIGGDTIALATRWRVLATEIDPQMAEILRHNLGVYGLLDRVDLVEGDIRGLIQNPDFRRHAGAVDAVFFDPARRSDGRRAPHTEAYEPPLSFAETLLDLCPNLCVKIGPTVELDALDYDCDIEVVSYKGEVRDTVLWFGGFKGDPAKRRRLATKLPEGVTCEREAGEPPPVGPPAAFLYEPDPAFIKAGLIDGLARRFGLSLLDRRLAYLTGADRVDDPVLNAYRIHRVLGTDHNAISACLAELGIGQVDFKARGVGVDLKNVHRTVRGRGKKNGLVVFTRAEGRRVALVCGYANKRR